MKIKGTLNEIYKVMKEQFNCGNLKSDKIYNCELKLYKGAKTDDQRSRYWSTLRDYALASRQPQTLVHNLLLEKLGYIRVNIKVDENGEEVIEYNKTYKPVGYDYLNDNRQHLKPTGKINDKGEEEYYILQNSEEFTTQQYSELMDFLTNEIIDNGYGDIIELNDRRKL